MAYEATDTCLRGIALADELGRVKWKKGQAVTDKEFLQATILTVEIELLEAQVSLESDNGGQLLEAQACLESMRLEADACLSTHSDPKDTQRLLMDLPVSKLKSLLKEFGLTAHGCLEKQDFLHRLGWRPREESDAYTACLGGPTSGVEATDTTYGHADAFGADAGDAPEDTESMPAEGASSFAHGRDEPSPSHRHNAQPWDGGFPIEPGESREELLKMSVSKLKQLMKDFGKATEGCIEKSDFVDRLKPTEAHGHAVASEFRAPASFSPALRVAAAGITASCTPAFTVEQRELFPEGGVARRPWEQSQYETREYWKAQMKVCSAREDNHAKQGPRFRRAYSWARSLAFARIWLGSSGCCKLRRGCGARPFVVWVLGAVDEVEADLAEAGFFDDANWVDWAPTEILLVGWGLRTMAPEEGQHAAEGHPPVVHTASYEDLPGLCARGPPDLVAVLMPGALGNPGEAAPGLPAAPPEAVLREVASVPVVVTMRAELPPCAVREVQRRLGAGLLLPPSRCPFSSAGRLAAPFADNAWLLAVGGGRALATLLALELPGAEEGELLGRPVLEKCAAAGGRRPAAAAPPPAASLAVFWGIVDLKYDPARPVLERVKVLETGDGRTSKFSHDGAEIPKRVRDGYRLKGGNGPQKYTVVSTDKRLTHDLMEDAGYGHVVPRQLCFPRKPDDDLAQRITVGLGAKDGEDGGDIVVLKLCNRSRGAGVLMVPAGELDCVLADLLSPPADLEAWFEKGCERLVSSCASDLGLERSDIEEQLRHWWGNESPSFVAEKFCTSTPTLRDGQAFDGTMRVSFMLRQRPGSATAEPAAPAAAGAVAAAASAPGGFCLPEDLELDWLGGYWKLPRSDLASPDLRGRSVSAARASGTAPVARAHLHEVYAALGDSMQQLFGGAEPSPEELAERYRAQPGLAAHLIARLGMSSMKDPDKVHAKLVLAQEIAERAKEGPGRRCIESFLCRGRGVCAIKPGVHAASAEQWGEAERHFRRSVELLPTNANALFWLGMAALEFGRLCEAVDLMNRSLLLDPDFKGPYVNLGAAYIRQGQYDRAVEISNAGLSRHPQSPQCHYHLGVASYQKAAKLYISDDAPSDELLALALEVALDGLRTARESEEAQKRSPAKTGRTQSPWLEADEQMAAEAEALAGCRSPAPRHIELPPTVGWRFLNWRT